MATRCAAWRTSGAPASIPGGSPRKADRWYGRGSADNKGQHALNLSALEAVLAERDGKLGFNLKLVLETCEERGSIGLRDFVAAHKRRAGRRCADRQRRPARHARGADDRHRHARHLPLRPGGRSASGRRAFRPLGRADHRSGRRADPRAGHHHRPAGENPGARLAAAERPAGERARRCWPDARSAAAGTRPRSIRTGASRG